MLQEELEQAESLISQFPSIPKFLGDWLTKELEKARQSEMRHIFLGYLTSPCGYIWAEKVGRIFETLMQYAPSECPRLRRKVTQATDQRDLESVLFELEIGFLLLKHGHEIEAEPLHPQRGPDFRVVLCDQNVYVEVKKLQHDAEEEYLWKTQDVWARTLTQSDLDKREWNLYQRYLATDQFPDEGWHILAIDTSKSRRADGLLARAWEDHCQDSASDDFPRRRTIHALVLCRREAQQHTFWLNDPTTGIEILHNLLSSMPDQVLEISQSIFRHNKGRA